LSAGEGNDELIKMTGQPTGRATNNGSAGQKAAKPSAILFDVFTGRQNPSKRQPSGRQDAEMAATPADVLSDNVSGALSDNKPALAGQISN